MWLILLFAFIYGVSFNVVTNDRYAVRNTINIYMMICLLFVSIKVNFGYGIITNLSVIWYSAAVALQIMCKVKCGSHFTMNTTVITLKTMIFLQVMVYILAQLPDLATIPIYHDFAIEIKTNINKGAVATYSAFVVSSAAVIFIIKKIKHHKSPFFVYTVAAIFSQVISSFAYYPIVFGFDYHMLSILITGSIVKICMTMLYYPLIYSFKVGIVYNRFNH